MKMTKAKCGASNPSMKKPKMNMGGMMMKKKPAYSKGGYAKKK